MHPVFFRPRCSRGRLKARNFTVSRALHSMEVDHIFVFVADHRAAAQSMAAAGLHETYRRVHHGQGTANVCYCFDNLFVELLWLTSKKDAAHPLMSRMGFLARSGLNGSQYCPFGIAWRGEAIDIPVWAFSPPYLPEGIKIDVAVDSDDPAQPLMFNFPGSTAPVTWSDEKRGKLQHDAGYSTVTNIGLFKPSAVEPSHMLKSFAGRAGITLLDSPENNYAMELTLNRLDGSPAHRLQLPKCIIV